MINITLRLACGHTIKMDKRPNPRKDWPDEQSCESCKKRQRVVEILTIGSPLKDTSRKPKFKKKRRKKNAK